MTKKVIQEEYRYLSLKMDQHKKNIQIKKFIVNKMSVSKTNSSLNRLSELIQSQPQGECMYATHPRLYLPQQDGEGRANHTHRLPALKNERKMMIMPTATPADNTSIPQRPFNNRAKRYQEQ